MLANVIVPTPGIVEAVKDYSRELHQHTQECMKLIATESICRRKSAETAYLVGQQLNKIKNFINNIPGKPMTFGDYVKAKFNISHVTAYNYIGAAMFYDILVEAEATSVYQRSSVLLVFKNYAAKHGNEAAVNLYKKHFKPDQFITLIDAARVGKVIKPKNERAVSLAAVKSLCGCLTSGHHSLSAEDAKVAQKLLRETAKLIKPVKQA